MLLSDYSHLRDRSPQITRNPVEIIGPRESRLTRHDDTYRRSTSEGDSPIDLLFCLFMLTFYRLFLENRLREEIAYL